LIERRILKPNLTLAVLVALYACGPAISDGEYSISGAPEYFYFDAGGNEKMIVLRLNKSREIVVSSRVNAHFVRDGKLLVSRSPRTVKKSESGALISYIDPQCEYWSIDLKSHVAKRESAPIEGLLCPI
jgi:hypothetical protein